MATVLMLLFFRHLECCWASPVLHVTDRSCASGLVLGIACAQCWVIKHCFDPALSDFIQNCELRGLHFDMNLQNQTNW